MHATLTLGSETKNGEILPKSKPRFVQTFSNSLWYFGDTCFVIGHGIF